MISIIIPTYNRAELLVEAVDSVLRQSYQDFELIIIDDGSCDVTESKIAAYDSNKITYRKQANHGPGHARNRGLELARGDYIAFLDSDDTWLDFKLEIQVGIMDYFTDIAFLCSDFFIQKENNRMLPNGHATWSSKPLDLNNVYKEKCSFKSLGLTPEGTPDDFTIHSGYIYHALLQFPYVLPSTSMVRASMLSDNTRFAEDINMYEDWVFFARLAQDSKSSYLATETTINRGHQDPQRLTQASKAYKSLCRLKLINHVWGKDAKFMNAFSNEVEKLRCGEYISAIRYKLLETDNSSARITLRQLREFQDFRMHGWLLIWALLAYIPFSSELLRLARSCKRYTIYILNLYSK